jgi:hypothetical protein
MKKIRVRGKNLETAMPDFLKPFENFDVKAFDINETPVVLTNGTVENIENMIGLESIQIKANRTFALKAEGANENIIEVNELQGYIGFFNSTPVGPQELTVAPLVDITFSEPGSDDFSIVITNTTPFGFSSADKANTVLSVVKNIQDRVKILENALTAFGFTY